MARDEDFNSAGTQFFIVHQDAHKLDGQYAAFGKMQDRTERVPPFRKSTCPFPVSGVFCVLIWIGSVRPMALQAVSLGIGGKAFEGTAC